MNYFCCGMIRSGSTWQYNIIKAILEKRKLAKQYGTGFIGSESDLEGLIKGDDSFFVKMHGSFGNALEEIKCGRAKAVYIHRDLRDVAASLMTKHRKSLQWVIENEHLLKAWYSHRQWTSVPGILIQQYEKVMVDILRAIDEIAAFLEVNLMPGELEELSDKFSIEKQKLRINNLPKSTIGQKQIRTLRRRTGSILYGLIGKKHTHKIARYFGKIGKGYMDPATLLWSEHINTGEIGSYKKTMNKKEQEKIELYVSSLSLNK